MAKRILVTGGAGYIGSHFVRVASESGIPLQVIDDLSTGNRWAIPSEVPFYRGDFSDEGMLRLIHAQDPFDTIVHFAAKTSVEDSTRNPGIYRRENAEKTRSLLEVSSALSVRNFVFSSTCAVYGTPVSGVVTEESPLLPENPYGATKLEAERSVIDIGGRTGLRYAILRYFNVAGAYHDRSIGQANASAKSLIQVCCEAAAGKRPHVVIHGDDYPTRDGTGERDYIHVEDLAFAHLEVLRTLNSTRESQIFNCGYGRAYSVRDVIAAVEAVSGKRLRVLVGSRRPGDIASIYSDSGKLMRSTCWRPRFDDLSEVCRSAYEWELRDKP